MTLHPNFIGCDTSKASIDLFDPFMGGWRKIANTQEALAELACTLDPATSFVVMEATGHHDRLLCQLLAEAAIPFARINPLQARRFAQAKGRLAKTDTIDAKGLSALGVYLQPKPAPAPDKEREHLAALAGRRDQLVAMRASELCRLEAVHDAFAKADIQAHLAELDNRVETLQQAINAAITKGRLAADATLLQSAPGIGPVTAATLLAHMPELGSLNPKAAASLAGLAPHPNESGQTNRARRLKGGRPRLRRALYMAALGAVRASQKLRTFYANLASRSGSKKLAILATARKLLTALNAMIRDNKTFA